MKKIIFLLLTISFSINVLAQIKISALPAKTGNGDSVWIPVVDGSTTKKIQGWQISHFHSLPLYRDVDTVKIDPAGPASDGYLSAADYAQFVIDSSKFDISGSGIRTKGDKRIGIGNPAPGASIWLDVVGDAKVNNLTIGQGGGGSLSTVLGVGAGASSGTSNTSIGWNAAAVLTTNFNVNVGYNNGFNNTGGAGCVSIGSSSFYGRSAGNYNIAIGYNTMTGGGSGGENVAVGKAALNGAGTFADNVAIGSAALNINTGNENTGIGRDVMILNTSGSANTAVGFRALKSSATGSSNIAIGDSAGHNLTTGSGNIFIGRTALASTTSISNELNIGGWIMGTNGLIGIGLLPTTDKLEVDGNLSLVTAGNKIKIATGSNASVGVSGAMTAGTITINTTAVTASSIIILTHQTLGGTQGILSVGTVTAGTSFVINSSSATDTGTVGWIIIN